MADQLGARKPDSGVKASSDASDLGLAVHGALVLAAADLPCHNGCGCEEFDYCTQDECRAAIPTLAELSKRVVVAERERDSEHERAKQAAKVSDKFHRTAIKNRERAEAAERERDRLQAQLDALRKCPNCNGTGKVRDSMLPYPVTCVRCNGTGRIARAVLAARPPTEEVNEPGENACQRTSGDTAVPDPGSLTSPAARPPTEQERLTACVEAWPECRDGDYNPLCCRFPKSCSCSAIPAARHDERPQGQTEADSGDAQSASGYGAGDSA